MKRTKKPKFNRVPRGFWETKAGRIELLRRLAICGNNLSLFKKESSSGYIALRTLYPEICDGFRKIKKNYYWSSEAGIAELKGLLVSCGNDLVVLREKHPGAHSALYKRHRSLAREHTTKKYNGYWKSDEGQEELLKLMALAQNSLKKLLQLNSSAYVYVSIYHPDYLRSCLDKIPHRKLDHAVYVLTLPDSANYFGMTSNIKNRLNKHRNTGAVYDYCLEHNLDQTKVVYTVLDENVNFYDAATIERETIKNNECINKTHNNPDLQDNYRRITL